MEDNQRNYDTIYGYTNSMVRSPDGDTEYIDIHAGISIVNQI